MTKQQIWDLLEIYRLLQNATSQTDQNYGFEGDQMIKLLFQVVVGLLLFVLIANLFAFMMPVLTHPVVAVFFLALIVLFARSLLKAYNNE